MTQKELTNLFSPLCLIENQILLVSPSDFTRLTGILIEKSRLFILVTNGSIKLDINGKRYDISSNVFIDILDTCTIQILECSDDIRAWGVFSTFEFASASLKTLRPGPLVHPQERLNIPIMGFSDNEIRKIEQQLNLLRDTLASIGHSYRQELAQLFFCSFNLEFGNALFNHMSRTEESSRYLDRKDFIVLNFLKLVSQYYSEKHRVEFYAEMLCISSKHLARIVKDATGKTPYFFICNEIVHKAMELLEKNDLSIGQISEELHFPDQASFCKFFKKQKHVYPMAYRQRYRPSNSAHPLVHDIDGS